MKIVERAQKEEIEKKNIVVIDDFSQAYDAKHLMCNKPTANDNDAAKKKKKNSRPLCPISDDPEEIMTLTPGHFLIGQALTTLPHPDVTHIPMGRLSLFQLMQKIVQDFWRNWSHEYLARLQQRPKWKQQHDNLEVGQLVLLMEDNTPPTEWNLGRIIKVFPGADKKVRCAEIMKIESNKKIIVNRPIYKLCLLPIEQKCNQKEKEIMINYCLAKCA